MLMSEIIQRVMDLARQVDEHYSRVLPKWYKNYPIVGPDEKDPPPPEAHGELLEFLTSLPGEDVYQVLLVMFLGRLDFAVRDLAENYEIIQNQFQTPENAISLMMSTAPLADYLADGLTELHAHGIDVDHLPLAETAAS